MENDPTKESEVVQKIKDFDAALLSLNEIKMHINTETKSTQKITLLFDHEYEFRVHDLNNLSAEQLIEKYQINHWLEKVIVKQYLKLNNDHQAFSKFILQNMT